MKEVNTDPAHVAGMFDAIAGRYDLLNHLFSVGLDRRWRARAIRAADLRPGDTVLDLCAGTGDLAIAAVSGCPGLARVIAIDFAAEMLRRGLAKAREHRLPPPILMVRGDAVRIPLRDASVDAVIVAFGVRNTGAPAAVFTEIRRVLRDNGPFVILEFGIPTAPVVRWLYLWYFHRVLPSVGRLISRHRRAYSYLPASVAAFSSPDAIAELLRGCDFCVADPVPLSLGIVYLYRARKCGRSADSDGRRAMSDESLER